MINAIPSNTASGKIENDVIELVTRLPPALSKVSGAELRCGEES